MASVIIIQSQIVRQQMRIFNFEGIFLFVGQSTACATTSTTTTPEITTTVISTTALPDLGMIPDGHPDYDILMHKPGHCSGLWTEWSDHVGLDDTSTQCSSPLSVDVRDKTYKHDWRVTGNVLVHVFDGEWFFGISDRDFRQGFTKNGHHRS